MPVAAMNVAGRAEKAVPRKGLPATMHIWWSRKPTGLARAVLFASVVDDPADRPDRWPSAGERRAERRRLLDLVADLARWDCPPGRIDEARHLVSRQCDGEPPAVVDPFCGGGTIPLEATRLGLPATAVDLNPVAALVTKGLVEIPATVAALGPVHPGPTAGPGTASGQPGPAAPPGGGADRPPMAAVGADVTRYGADLLAAVRDRIGDAFPPVTTEDGTPTTAVSYLWARTAGCANPGCRAELPLLSTWWLSKRASNPWHLAPVPPERSGPGARLGLRVVRGAPPDGQAGPKVGSGANFRCVVCGEVTPAAEVREQAAGAGIGLRLVAVQVLADPSRRRGGRAWVAPSPGQEAAALGAWPEDRDLPLPAVELPPVAGNLHAFGMRTVGDLLTPRQRLLMVTMCEELRALRPRIEADARAAGITGDVAPLRRRGRGARAYAEAVTTYLGLAVSRMANRVSTMTVHNRANGSVEQSFVQPGYAFYGDFPEANPFSGSTGSFASSLEHVAAAVTALPAAGPGGPSPTVTCASALEALPGGRGIVSTDPPYYDMFDYSALSNLFYPWLRLALRDVWPEETASLLAPDTDQIVSNPARFGRDRGRARSHFETRLRQAFAMLRDTQLDGYPLTLYYGYQQTERREGGRSSTAWEALLGALIESGFQVVSTWPLRSERPEGVKTGSNALASSVLLACRSRPEAAPTGSRRELLAALRASLVEAVATLQEGNVAPVDLAQSAIGPGMAVFSSYGQVLEADGSPMPVRTVLEQINRILDEILSGSEAAFDPATRWAVTWFEERGTGPGDHGHAEQLSRSRNISLATLADLGIVAVEAGKVRLRRRDETGAPAPGSGPVGRERSTGTATVWTATQQLLHALEQDGEKAAGRLLGGLPPGTAAAAKELAYRLHMACDRNRWPREAAAYNGLVRSWAELQRLA